MLGRGKELPNPSYPAPPIAGGRQRGTGFTVAALRSRGSSGWREKATSTVGRPRVRVRKQPLKHRLSWSLIRVALGVGV